MHQKCHNCIELSSHDQLWLKVKIWLGHFYFHIVFNLLLDRFINKLWEIASSQPRLSKSTGWWLASVFLLISVQNAKLFIVPAKQDRLRIALLLANTCYVVVDKAPFKKNSEKYSFFIKEGSSFNTGLPQKLNRIWIDLDKIKSFS